MNNGMTSQIIAQILIQELGLPATSVWVRDQNVPMPNDNGLYIIVGETGSIPFGNTTEMVTENGNQHQINTVLQLENIMIDIVSASNLALLRKIEVLMALQSFYAQQQQELNLFKIFRIPTSFIRTSEPDGGRTINRYSMTIACHVWYSKDTVMNSPLGTYFESFEAKANDDKTINTGTPIADFTINGNTTPPPYPPV